MSDVFLDPFFPFCVLILTSVVCVTTSIEGNSELVVYEEHVLSVIVDQVALLFGKLKLGNEAGNSQFLYYFKDIQFLVKSCAGLALKRIDCVVFASQTETPGRGEVFLATEAPHRISEWFSTIVDFCVKVRSEICFVFGRHWVVVAMFMFLLLNVVVQLLCHRVVKRKALIGSQNVTNKTQHNR